MVGRKAMKCNALTMFLGGVARIVVPTVVGISLVQLSHVVITIGLGKNRGRSNCELFAVALDDRFLGYVVVGLIAVTVDDNKFGAYL